MRLLGISWWLTSVAFHWLDLLTLIGSCLRCNRSSPTLNLLHQRHNRPKHSIMIKSEIGASSRFSQLINDQPPNQAPMTRVSDLGPSLVIDIRLRYHDTICRSLLEAPKFLNWRTATHGIFIIFFSQIVVKLKIFIGRFNFCKYLPLKRWTTKREKNATHLVARQKEKKKKLMNSRWREAHYARQLTVDSDADGGAAAEICCASFSTSDGPCADWWSPPDVRNSKRGESASGRLFFLPFFFLLSFHDIWFIFMMLFCLEGGAASMAVQWRRFISTRQTSVRRSAQSAEETKNFLIYGLVIFNSLNVLH